MTISPAQHTRAVTMVRDRAKNQSDCRIRYCALLEKKLNAILAFWLVHCISVTTDYTNVLPYMEINAANVIFFVGSQVSSTKKMDETKNKFGELSTKEIQEITDNVVPVTKRP